MINFNSILKKMLLFTGTFILPVFLIMLLVIVVISPALWIGNMVGDFVDSIFGYKGDFQKDTDSFVYRNKLSIASDELMNCTLIEDNPTACFNYFNDEGIIEETKGDNFYEPYLAGIEEYHGSFDDEELYERIHIVGKYQLEYLETEYDTNTGLPIGSKWVLDETVYDGACNSLSGQRCVILQDDYYLDRFYRPSTGQILSRYGFYSKGQDSLSYEVSFKPYQELNGNPVAFSDGRIAMFTKDKIIIEKEYNGNTFQFIYEGNFGSMMCENEVLPRDVLTLSETASFKFYVLYDNQYVNPALFYNTSIVLGEDGDGTDVPEQAEEGYRAYITTQVEPDMNLWDKVSFKQPFELCIITQCAEVIGVGDGGNPHTALDMISGTDRGNLPLPSTISGKVVEVGYSSISGNFITIEHIETGVRVNYNHMQYRSIFNVGDEVNQGDILGYMGDTGLSFGVHLHMNVYQPMNEERTKYGWVNPMFLMTNFSYADGCPECSY